MGKISLTYVKGRKAGIAFAIIALLVTSVIAFSTQLRPTEAQPVATPVLNLSENVGAGTKFSGAPGIAVKDDNTPFVVWFENMGGTNNDIFFSRSTNSGVSFSTPINLSNNVGNSINPVIAAGPSRNLYVIWIDDTTSLTAVPPFLPANPEGDEEIFYRRSTDNGVTWGPTINLSSGTADSSSPKIVARTTFVHVVWKDDLAAPAKDDVFYRRSINSGAAFQSIIPLSNNAGDSLTPDIVITSSNVYIAWRDDTPGNEDILFRRSTNNGGAFSAALNVSDNAGQSIDPEIRGDAALVYILWRDDTPGNEEIFFARSTDSGTTFASQNVSNNAGTSFFPSMSHVTGVTTNFGVNSVYVAWRDGTGGDYDALFKRSTDNGATFLLAPIDISNDAVDSRFPKVALRTADFFNDKEQIFVVWRGDVGGNYDVFFSKSIDEGLTFPPEDPTTPFPERENVSNTPGDSRFAQVGVAKNFVFFFWRDDTDTDSPGLNPDGDEDIFFRRLPKDG